ncbi:MAG: hypothetical protein QME76_12885 [Bacillota bacterium]|nr:hypothetical protein [Bacillota bacterium]
MFIDFSTLGPAFVVVEEPAYSRQRLLAFQRSYGIHTAVLFDCLRKYGVLPLEIPERDLALWEHFYDVFLEADGDPLDLEDSAEEGASPLSYFWH